MSTPIQFKTINYRGGLVRFRIPTDWIEEYEPEGGGMFYADGPDTGTLRLNVLTSVREGGGPMEPAAEFLSNLSGLDRAATPVIVHSDGNASTSYWEFGEERGHELAFRYWQVASQVPPDHMRLAIFSYAMLRSQMKDARFVGEGEMIDGQVRKCEFAKELGIFRP